MSAERIGVAVSATPAPEHVSYVAGAIVEVLAAGAEHRTSESVMHAALNVLRDASAAAPSTVKIDNVSLGDERITKFGTELHSAPAA